MFVMSRVFSVHSVDLSSLGSVLVKIKNIETSVCETYILEFLYGYQRRKEGRNVKHIIGREGEEVSKKEKKLQK